MASALFRFPGAVRRDGAVGAWFAVPDDVLRRMVQPWFERLRDCGPDVRELIHDGRPTACVGEAASAYVDAFSGHANIGFFFGAALPNPASLLQGTGKRMRHVKIAWGKPVDEAAVGALIATAYQDMRRRPDAEA